MALRIGLLILASCNLYHADLITTTRLTTLATQPVVSFPLDADSQDDRHDNDAPKLGQKLQPLGYNPPKEQKPAENKVVVVQARNSERHGGSKGKQGRRQHPVVVTAKKPVAVVVKQPVAVLVKQPVAVAVVQPVPRPAVIITSTVIGNNAVHSSPIKYDNDHINVNKTPVNFGTLNYVDTDKRQPAKTPITVVTVPEISTAKPTEHKVGPNQVINQSNIPSVEEFRNRLADQLVFSYNNLLNTKIKEIVDVPLYSQTTIAAPVKSELVKPGKLEHAVQGQLRVGEIYENAPIVVQKFLTSSSERSIGYHEDREHQVRKNA